ncbi:MAG TPA: hypothetical protein VJT71_03015 [Pyrinomonadaceae bacterium]|nr:hypothetical protein [Pyrinomonadaceae bacterium]
MFYRIMMLIPDRLPSLVLLGGFWVPPAMIGWAAAEFFHRNAARVRAAVPYALLTIFVLVWSAVWFLFQIKRMPPYIPGSTMDPTFASPEAVAGLAVVASALVLPGTAIACLLAFRLRRRALRRSATEHFQ